MDHLLSLVIKEYPDLFKDLDPNVFEKTRILRIGLEYGLRNGLSRLGDLVRNAGGPFSVTIEARISIEERMLAAGVKNVALKEPISRAVEEKPYEATFVLINAQNMEKRFRELSRGCGWSRCDVDQATKEWGLTLASLPELLVCYPDIKTGGFYPCGIHGADVCVRRGAIRTSELNEAWIKSDDFLLCRVQKPVRSLVPEQPEGPLIKGPYPNVFPKVVRGPFSLTIKAGQELLERIEAGAYDFWHAAVYFPENFPHAVVEETYQEDFVLFDAADNSTDSRRYEELMSDHDLIPANLPELLAFGAAYPDLQLEFDIVSLHKDTRWRVRGDGDRFPTLSKGEEGRRLSGSLQSWLPGRIFLCKEAKRGA